MRRTLVITAAVALALSGCGGGDGPDTSRSAFVDWATEQGGLDEAAAECVADDIYADLSPEELERLLAIDEDTAEADVDAAPTDQFVDATVACSLEG